MPLSHPRWTHWKSSKQDDDNMESQVHISFSLATLTHDYNNYNLHHILDYYNCWPPRLSMSTCTASNMPHHTPHPTCPVNPVHNNPHPHPPQAHALEMCWCDSDKATVTETWQWWGWHVNNGASDKGMAQHNGKQWGDMHRVIGGNSNSTWQYNGWHWSDDGNGNLTTMVTMGQHTVWNTVVLLPELTTTQQWEGSCWVEQEQWASRVVESTVVISVQHVVTKFESPQCEYARRLVWTELVFECRD